MYVVFWKRTHLLKRNEQTLTRILATHVMLVFTEVLCCSESSANMRNQFKSKTTELTTELAKGTRVADDGFQGFSSLTLKLLPDTRTQDADRWRSVNEGWAGMHKEKRRQEDRGCPPGKVLQPVS